MALVHKGPSRKKQAIMAGVVIGAGLLAYLYWQYGSVSHTTGESGLPQAPLIDQVELKNTLALSQTLKGLVDFINNLPQWKALQLAPGIGTTTPSGAGRSDPFAIIPELSPSK